MAIDHAAIGIGLSIVGIKTDRRVEIGQCLRKAPGASEHGCAHVIGLRVVGVALDHGVLQRRKKKRVAIMS